MKTKLIFAVVSILVLGSTLTVVFVIESNPIYPDPSKFKSEITRIADTSELLDLLHALESVTGNSIYFDSLGEEFDSIENVSQLITDELEFLSTYNPKDFNERDWRYHKLIYIGTVIDSINNTEFLSLFNLEQLYPYHLFYYNFTEEEYYANSTFVNPYVDPDTWNISEIFEYVFSLYPEYIFVNQTVDIGDIYAPLAGTGTYLERIWLCLPTGQPILFFSNEGLWWIS